MANGEDSGTWGSITNTNWNLMEQAVSGVQTITMSNANYTLTNLNGVSDEARNMVLVVNGTNSAICQVVAPLVNKFYVVSNQTTGGYAITIGGASGSVITVPSGTTVQVYCDGTNFYSAQTSSAGNFVVNGNLGVSGTSTLVGNTLVGGTLGVAGNATLAGNLTVSGVLTSTNSAKAWANFTGGTSSPLTINGSYNVTQINRTSLGKYTVNFTSSISGSYSVVASPAVQLGQTVASWVVPLITNQNSNGFQIDYVGVNGANFDIDNGNFAVFG